MSEFTFADRYAQSALSPNAQIITFRQTSASRIVESATPPQIHDLVAAYYGSPHVNMHWFRDEFAKEDASFSLVNNEREMKVLAALILEQLLSTKDPEAILGILTGNAGGQRSPEDAPWLLHAAKEAFVRLSVANRETEVVDVEVTSTINPKLKDEVAGIEEGDWAGLVATLAKMRAEAQASDRNVAAQTKKALKALNRELELRTEEAQILWWLFSGHSKTLERGFSSFSIFHAAVVGAVDLGVLTTVSHLGPVAAPAILERVLSGAKKGKTQPVALATIIDGIDVADLKKLTVSFKDLPPWLAPISTALKLAESMGANAWHARYSSQTSLNASFIIEPLVLANQLYREHLLSQFL